MRRRKTTLNKINKNNQKKTKKPKIFLNIFFCVVKSDENGKIVKLTLKFVFFFFGLSLSLLLLMDCCCAVAATVYTPIVLQYYLAKCDTLTNVQSEKTKSTNNDDDDD